MDIIRLKQADLDKLDDITFATLVLTERRNRLSNPYTPLGAKLSGAIATLEKIRAKKEN